MAETHHTITKEDTKMITCAHHIKKRDDDMSVREKNTKILGVIGRRELFIIKKP